MAPRANWKGFLKIGKVSRPVALYAATPTSERIAFHALSRKPRRSAGAKGRGGRALAT